MKQKSNKKAVNFGGAEFTIKVLTAKELKAVAKKLASVSTHVSTHFASQFIPPRSIQVKGLEMTLEIQLLAALIIKCEPSRKVRIFDTEIEKVEGLMINRDEATKSYILEAS
jgi:pyruvate kinase